MPRLVKYRNRMKLVDCPAIPPHETGMMARKQGQMTAPICLDIVDRLLEWREDIEVDDGLELALQSMESHSEELDKLRSLDGSRPIFELSGEFKRDIWEHQRSGGHWLMYAKRAILADDQGAGKTVTAIVGMKLLAVVRPLVICSNRKRQDWVDHIRDWTGEEARILGNGDTPDWKECKWWICNYHQVGSQPGDLLDCDSVIADEAHAVKNRKTQAFSGMRDICAGIKPIFLLTATPNLNSAYDIWTLLHLCDPARFSSYWSFAYRFCYVEEGQYGVKVEGLRKREQESLDVLIKRYTLRRTRPPSSIRRRRVMHRLHGDQRRLYKSLLENRELLWIHEGEEYYLDVPSAVSLITRLRQMATDPGIILPGYDGPSKVDTLIEVVRERESKCIVFTMQSRLAVRIVDALKAVDIVADVLHGKQTPKRQNEAVAGLTDGDTMVLVATHGTGGEGLNLVAADRVIFMEMAWHPGGNRHAQNRVDRPGQMSDDIECILIHCPETVEDHIDDIIRHKEPVTAMRIAEAMEVGE